MICAPWIARQKFTWPHGAITLEAFEAEAQAVKAAVTDAWIKNQEHEARDHLAKLCRLSHPFASLLTLAVIRCKEINKARLSLSLLPIAVLWDGRRPSVVELFIDWEYMQDNRSSTDLHCKRSKYDTANVHDEEAKLRLEMAHAHVALHVLRTDLYEAWYRKPEDVSHTQHGESAECLSCRGPLTPTSPPFFFADDGGPNDHEGEGAGSVALPPYKEG